MTFIEKWVEYDYNPFILFDQNGKVLSLNQEAQFLLGKVKSKTIFNIAVDYASDSFGFKTHFMDIELEGIDFFAITVGYESEEEIGVKLYKHPRKKIRTINTDKTEETNLYLIIDLAISSNSCKSGARFTKEYDPAIPETCLNVDEFLKLLNKIYQAFCESENIHTQLFIAIGEYIKIEKRKFPMIKIEISGDGLDTRKKRDIESHAQNTQATVTMTQDRVVLDLPLLTK